MMRDMSAFTTLDNANMSRDFDKWYLDFLKQKQRAPTFVEAFDFHEEEIGSLRDANKRLAFHNRQLQAEIDALKAEVARLTSYVDAFRREEDRADKLDRQVDDLTAEVAKLKADAEQSAALLKVFMFSEVQSREELEAGKELIQKYAAMKDFSTQQESK